MIAFQSDPHQFKAKWIERLALPKVLKNVSSVVTVSKTTADDLQQLFPNINAPVTPIYAGGPQDVVASSCDGNYILCLSTLNPRKNQLGLIKAYNQLPKNLRDQYKLYLAGGRGWNDDEIVELAKTSNGVDWKGYVSIEEAEELWQHATCFALSSFYEGFGLPVLEAQLRGIPTLTSDRGALKEVASPGCVLVNPDSVDSITQGLIELLTNKPAPDKVFASQFSWQKTAEDLINAIA
jgi:glycosyltransferase involved in cell wall biosynthesis